MNIIRVSKQKRKKYNMNLFVSVVAKADTEDKISKISHFYTSCIWLLCFNKVHKIFLGIFIMRYLFLNAKSMIWLDKGPLQFSMLIKAINNLDLIVKIINREKMSQEAHVILCFSVGRIVHESFKHAIIL